MKSTSEIKSEISELFKKMHTKEDLLHLLNKTKRVLYQEKCFPLSMNQLTWYYSPISQEKRYYEFSIKKKSGDARSIHAPVAGLKEIQRCLAFILDCVYEPHESAMGFRTAYSIADNAAKHVGSKYVYNIDLQDFFPSIDQARVWKCLQLKPFHLEDNQIRTNVGHYEDAIIEIKNKTRLLTIKYQGLKFLGGLWEFENQAAQPFSYKVLINRENRNEGKITILKSIISEPNNDESIDLIEDWNENEIEDTLKLIIEHQQTLLNSTSRIKLANIIASLCCAEMIVNRKDKEGYWVPVKKNVLPQGAPTSPIITNIICKRLDIRLSGVARRFGLKYSRYADDITFSSEHNVYQKESEFCKEIERVITEQRFTIKASKTRLQKQGYRQEVTGLLVNKKVNVQKRYIKQLRNWLFLLEKYTYNKAASIFFEQYYNDKGNIKQGGVTIEKVIYGKLQYLKMIKGSTSPTYVKLKERIDRLTNKSKVIQKHSRERIEPLTILYSIRTKSKNVEIFTPEVLDDIFESGLDEAMKKIKSNS